MIKEWIEVKYLSEYDLQPYNCKNCNLKVKGQALVYHIRRTNDIEDVGGFYVTCSGECLMKLIRTLDKEGSLDFQVDKIIWNRGMCDPLNISKNRINAGVK